LNKAITPAIVVLDIEFQLIWISHRIAPDDI